MIFFVIFFADAALAKDLKKFENDRIIADASIAHDFNFWCRKKFKWMIDKNIKSFVFWIEVKWCSILIACSSEAVHFKNLKVISPLFTPLFDAVKSGERVGIL